MVEWQEKKLKKENRMQIIMKVTEKTTLNIEWNNKSQTTMNHATTKNTSTHTHTNTHQTDSVSGSNPSPKI